MMKMRMQVFFVVKHTRERLELVRFTSLDFFFVDEYHVVKLSKVRLLMDWLVLVGPCGKGNDGLVKMLYPVDFIA